MISAVVAIGGAVIGSASAAAQTVYSNDFSGSIGAEWSPNAAIVVTPSGERVLGTRTSGTPQPVALTETLTLTLAGLPPHTQVALTVDLYTLRSWDGNGFPVGNGFAFGPDWWDLDATGTAPDIQPRTTFSNLVSVNQSYPDAYPANHPGTTGSAATGDLLGFGTSGNNEIPAVRYALSYAFTHADGVITFSFRGENLQHWGDEGWVLDNVVVSVTPACPPGDDDLDDDGLDDKQEDVFGGLLGDSDSDDDGVRDGNEDSDDDGDDDEDEDDDEDDCPNDEDGDGEDDEDEDDEDEDEDD